MAVICDSAKYAVHIPHELRSKGFAGFACVVCLPKQVFGRDIEHNPLSFTSPYVQFAIDGEEDMGSHLSKRSSDRKRNGTQEKTLFSSTVFNTFSHGVIRFLVSVSSENHLLAG